VRRSRGAGTVLSTGAFPLQHEPPSTTMIRGFGLLCAVLGGLSLPPLQFAVRAARAACRPQQTRLARGELAVLRLRVGTLRLAAWQALGMLAILLLGATRPEVSSCRE
jgi:hypothetical protein